MVSGAQGTISDLERGSIRINASALAVYAQALNKSAQYLYPAATASDLAERE